MFGNHLADQYARREWGRERDGETPRALGDMEAFRERPVLFQEYCYTPQNVEQLYPAASLMGSEDVCVCDIFGVFPWPRVILISDYQWIL